MFRMRSKKSQLVLMNKKIKWMVLANKLENVLEERLRMQLDVLNSLQNTISKLKRVLLRRKQMNKMKLLNLLLEKLVVLIIQIIQTIKILIRKILKKTISLRPHLRKLKKKLRKLITILKNTLIRNLKKLNPNTVKLSIRNMKKLKLGLKINTILLNNKPQKLIKKVKVYLVEYRIVLNLQLLKLLALQVSS